MTSPVTTRQKGTSPSQSTGLSLLLCELEVSFETAWYSSAQNTMPIFTMEEPPQVGYGSVRSPTKAPSEPHVHTVAAAVPEIAALPSKQLSVQDSPKTAFGPSFCIENGRQRGLSVSRCNISVGTSHHTCFTQGQRGAIRALHLVVVEERTARARQGFAHGIKWRSVGDKEDSGSTRQGRTCDVNGRVIVQTIGTTRFQKSDPVTIVLVPLGISSTAHKAAGHFGRLPMMATERFPSSRVPVKVPALLV